LRNKYLKECERSKALEIANTQLSALIDELKSNQDGTLKIENSKLRKEISDKERQINSLNSIVDKLKTELNEEKSKVHHDNYKFSGVNFNKMSSNLNNLDVHHEGVDHFNMSNMFEQNTGNNFDQLGDHPKSRQHNLSQPDLDLFENNNKQKQLIVSGKDNQPTGANFSNFHLVKENEFLKGKFQKYQMKYIKFKYKYRTLKSITKGANAAYSFLNPEILNSFLSQKQRRSSFDKKSLNASHSKNLKDFKDTPTNAMARRDSVFSHSELFDNKNNYMFENTHNQIEEFVCHKEPKQSDTHKFIKKEQEQISEKSESEQESEQEEEIKPKKRGRKKATEKVKEKKAKIKDKKNKKEKKKSESNKKSKKKIIEESDDENESKSSQMDVESENEDQIEIKEPKIKKEQEIKEVKPHIRPIKKVKTDETLQIKKQKEEFFENFKNFVDHLKFDEDSVKTYLSTFESNLTFYEKINKILDIIFESPMQFNLVNLLYFLKIFIITYQNKNIFVNFSEYILSNYEFIINKKDKKFLVTEENILDGNLSLKIIFNHLNNVEISYKYSSTHYLISYIIALFYNFTGVQSENAILLFELFERVNNPETKEILILFRKLTKNTKVNLELNYEKEIENCSRNINKIYFFDFYINKIITFYILNFMEGIIDKWEDSQDETEILISSLSNKILELDDTIELKESNNDKINFAGDIRYLEIVQMLHICFLIKDSDWVFINIFQNVLWNQFLNTQEESQKRVGIIFFISMVYNHLVMKDTQLEKQSTKEIMGWVFSIINPTFTEQKISLYDRVAALSEFIDTPMVKFDPSVHSIISSVVNNLLANSNRENFPEDFLEKIKKMNLII
jgi:hypothetical protein